jgi:hypothetical protein
MLYGGVAAEVVCLRSLNPIVWSWHALPHLQIQFKLHHQPRHEMEVIVAHVNLCIEYEQRT